MADLNVKQQLIKACIDVGKALVLMALTILILRAVDWRVVGLIEKWQAVNAAQQVSTQINNERTMATVELIRSGKRLQHTVRVLDLQVSVSPQDAHDLDELEKMAAHFRRALNEYRSYMAEFTTGNIALETDRLISLVLSTYSSPCRGDEIKSLKIDLILLDYQLSKLLNVLWHKLD